METKDNTKQTQVPFGNDNQRGDDDNGGGDGGGDGRGRNRPPGVKAIES